MQIRQTWVELRMVMDTLNPDRYMEVVIEGNTSRKVPVDTPGHSPGALLFLFHVNDLPLSVTSKVRLFYIGQSPLNSTILPYKTIYHG